MGNRFCRPSRTVFNPDGVEDGPRSEERIAKKSLSVVRTRMILEKCGDPFREFEVMESIGAGGGGEVSRVRRRSGSGGSSTLGRSSSAWGTDPVPGLGSFFEGGIFKPCALMDRCSGTKQGKVAPSTNPSERSACSETISMTSGSISSFPGLSQRPSSDVPGGHNHHRAHYALKSIGSKGGKVTSRSSEELGNEVEVLKKLDHPGIVKLFETFHDGDGRCQFLVLELCSGGDLHRRDSYTEEESLRIARSVLSAVAYMHGKNVVHRDIKYENIMFASDSPESDVKIVDFGLSKMIGPAEYMKTGVGTIYCMAPEVFERKYTSQADLWSMGVVAYMLLSSQLPFYGDNFFQLSEKIKKGRYDFNGRRWKNVSREAKGFVSDLLQLCPRERPTASEALNSTWLNECVAGSDLIQKLKVMENIKASLETFASYGVFEKLVLTKLALKSTSEEVRPLSEAFFEFDEARTGTISNSEFNNCLQNYGCSREELEVMFFGADTNGSGFIEYTEFLAATMEALGIIDEYMLEDAFDHLDSNGSGYITVHDLCGIISEVFAWVDYDSVMAQFCSDNAISYNRFLELWSQRECHCQHATALIKSQLRISEETLMLTGNTRELETPKLHHIFISKMNY